MTGIETKVAQAATKVAQQGTQQSSVPGSVQTGDNSQFMSVLQQHQSKIDAANGEIMQAFGFEHNPHPAENAVSANHLEISVANVEQLESGRSTDKIANMLSNLNHGGLQMEKLTEMLTSGPKLNNRELLAMQAMMHQLAMESQVAVQMMDASKSAVQTMVQRTTQ